MKRVAALLIAVLLLAAMPVLAQMNGARLSGTVKDPTGAVVTDAKVTVRNEATGITQTMNTGSAGIYIFRGLQPGTYDIRAERTGFQTVEAKGLTLMIGQDMGYDLVLKVGTVSEVLDVTAETPLVETQKAQIDSVITNDQIMNTPVFGRYFMDLLFYSTPGVAGNNNGGLGEGFSVNGQRGYANQFNIDGVTKTNSTLGSSNGRINMDSIQEFQILTHQFEPQYGNANGAVINVATKGGTNNYHGSAYGIIYDSSLNAYNAYQKRMDYVDSIVNGTPVVHDKPQSYSHVYGGSFGGPIKQNKLFFFGSYEYSKEIDGYKILAPQEYNDIAENGPVSGVWSGRLDYTPSDKNSFNLRYSGQRSNGIWGPGGYNTMSTQYREIYQPQSGAFTWMRTISARTLSELRLQFQGTFDSGDSTQNLQYPYVEYHPHAVVGKLPNVPFDVPEYNGQAVYNLSMTRGRHDIKIGGSYQRVISDGSNKNFGDGEYDFAFDLPFDATHDPGVPIYDPTNGWTSPYWAAYTYPWHYIRRIGADGWNVPENVFGVFAQDKWSIRDNFVLTYGMRYDYEDWFNAIAPAGTLEGKKVANPSKNFAPRISFAYSPVGPKTVIRGGFGRFYGRTPLNEGALIIQNTINTRDQHWVEDVWGWAGGNLPTDPCPTTWNGAPLPAHPWVGDTSIMTCEFPTHVVQYPVPPELGSFIWNNGSIDVLDRNVQTPYTDHYTLGIQRQLSSHFAINADFVRITGNNIWIMVDRNAPDPSGTPDAWGYLPRPNPDYKHITTQSSIGKSWYTALETTLKYTGNKGAFTLTYTRSKSIDDVRGDMNSYGTTCSWLVNQDPANLRCDRGLSANDLPHRLTFDGSYNLPFGFVTSGVVDFHSGYPWTVRAGHDLNGDEWTGDTQPGYSRNSMRGDRYIWTQLRLGRKFRIGERYNLEPFVDVFNITNTPSYVGYDGNFLNQGHGNLLQDTFGKPTGSTGPRIWQFGARLTF